MSIPVSVQLAALSVAMGATVNDLDPLAVDDCLTQAQQLLASDHPLYRAVTGFATQYQLCRHDTDALAMQGRILRGAVETACGAAPLRHERSDIDG